MTEFCPCTIANALALFGMLSLRHHSGHAEASVLQQVRDICARRANSRQQAAGQPRG